MFINFSNKKKEQRDLKPITHHPLGLWSFDKAFMGYEGELGFPADGIVEISGNTNCGKSTLMYSLAGMFSARMKTNIAMVDVEGFNPKYTSMILSSTGFTGNVISCNGQTDEQSLDNLVEAMFENCNIGILDSIGAISPISEQSGDLGEANMGRRAKLLAQLSRKTVHMMNSCKEPKIIMMSNHLNPIIGGRGAIAPGGVTKDYLSSVRIRVKRKEEFPDGSYVIEGKVGKNRYGYCGRIFHLFVLVGYGVHQGLTSMYEGMLAGVVTRKSFVKIGEENFGRLKDIITIKSREADQSFFQPFSDALKGISDAGNQDTDETNSEANEPSEDSEL